jgi:6-phosphogluconolactonase
MDLKVFSNPAEVARAAAEHFVNLKPTTVALSGGSTPRVLYELLANPNEPFRKRIPWVKTHFFFSDERHVPPDHPDSNYRMVNESLFSRVPVPQQNIHRIPAEKPVADDAAENYEADLRRFFGEGIGGGLTRLADGLPGEAIPAFDVILLGLGEDGHTASIFPGSEVLHETKRWVAAPWVEKLNTYRITLTLPVLNYGESVVFLVTGASKAEILRTVMNTDRNPDLYPAQAISPTNGAVSWFVDEAAARLCSTNSSSNAGAASDLLNRKP